MSFEDKPYLRKIQLKRDKIERFNRYPFCIPAVKELDQLDFHPDVTFFVGENGSGKSRVWYEKNEASVEAKCGKYWPVWQEKSAEDLSKRMLLPEDGI